MERVLKALHTNFVESIEVNNGLLVREDYYKFPASQSNIYFVFNNEIQWFAEKPNPNDAFANPIRISNQNTFQCATWSGFECTLDLANGKPLEADFTK